VPQCRFRAVVAERTARRRRSRSAYEAWLDERDERRPLTGADLHSQIDEIAARVVAERGGMQDVIDGTGLHTLENVVRSVDPAILKDAYDNDLLRQAPLPPTWVEERSGGFCGGRRALAA
jgi:hypothetical protein